MSVVRALLNRTPSLRLLKTGLAASTLMLVRLLQPLNALGPMLETLEGMVTLVRPVQPENAWLPMLVTPSDMVTLVSALQL